MSTKKETRKTGIFALAFIAMAMLMLVSDASAHLNVTVVLGTAPADNAWESDAVQNFTFSTNATVGGIANASLWGNWAGTWALNQTNQTVIENNTANMYINMSSSLIPEGTWLWNIEVYDSLGNSSFASANRTINIDRTNPTVTMTALPASTICVLTLTGTVTDTNPDDCSFTDSIDGTIAASLSGSTCTADAEYKASAGAHTIYLTGTDDASNSANTASRTFSCQSGGGSSSGGGGGASQSVVQTQTTTQTQTNTLYTAPVHQPSNPLATAQNTIRTMANNLRVTIVNITDAIKGLLGIH